MFSFPVTLTPAVEGGYVVTFHDIPEAITQGEDMDEAMSNAAAALETALDCYMDDKRDLPRPSEFAALPRVGPSDQGIAKLMLYLAMRT